MKRVMIFVDWFEPGYKAGGPIRSCVNLAERLGSVAEVRVVTGDTDYNESEPYKDVTTGKWMKRGMKEVFYVPKGSRLKLIKDLLLKEKPDVIYLNSMFSPLFSLWPLTVALFYLSQCRIILAPRGMLAAGALSVKPIKKKLFLNFFSFLPLKRIGFHATNPEEKNDIERMFPKAIVHVAPNLVEDHVADTFHDKSGSCLKLVSIARISPEKNLLFFLESMREVKSRTLLTVFGTVNNHSYWENCQSVIKELPSNISVEYKGAIEPDKIRIELRDHDFLVLPTLGENFGHVIIESLSSATPVIISDRTPWTDLENRGCGFIRRLDRNEWSEIITKVSVIGQIEYTGMSEAARAYASEYVQRKNDINSYAFLWK